MRSRKQSLVAVVNSVVGSVCDGDQVVGIEEAVIAIFELLEGDRIQVMNVETLMDLIAINTQIACVVANDDLVTSLTPLSRRVEALIHPTGVTERRSTYLTFEREIVKPLFEGLKLPQV